jgi:hypothetical protein
MKTKIMQDKKSIKEFTDRELLELLLSNQVTLYREIRYVRDGVGKSKKVGRGQYWISFMNMFRASEDILAQTNDYLKRKNEVHENYDEETMGRG